MTEYIVEEADDAERLAERVRHRLRDGWRLQGGVSVALIVTATSYGSTERHPWYAQALIRETDT